jgi:phospholipase/carboxylesterase
VQPVTINNGMEMRAWYDIAMNDISRLPDEGGIRESQAAVERLIARERDRGIDSSRIVLAGFSQGGAIALQTGLRHANRLGGIVALSTYLPLEDSLDAEASSANRATPIFMAHGTDDPVVPVQLAEISRALLQKRGYEVEWHTWPMPHSVCGEEIEAVSAFLGRILGGGGAHAARSSILLP